MATVAELEAILKVDNRDAMSGLRTFENALGGVGDVIGGIGSVITAVSGAFAGLFGGAIAAAGAYEKEMALLGAIEQSSLLRNEDIAKGMKGVAYVTHMTAFEVDNLATSFENLTTFSKEQTIQAIRWSETFTSINRETMPKAVEAAMNLSTVFGRDLRTAIIMVDKALQDPVKGVDNLRRIGVQFTEQQKEQIQALVNSGKVTEAQAIIMRELNIELGNAARTVGETLVGKLQIFGNLIKRVFQEAGAVLLPFAKSFMDMAINVIQNMGKMSPDIIKLGAALTIAGIGFGALLTVIGALLSPLGLFVAIVAGIGSLVATNFQEIVKAITPIYSAIKPEIDAIVNVIKSVWDALNYKPDSPLEITSVSDYFKGTNELGIGYRNKETGETGVKSQTDFKAYEDQLKSNKFAENLTNTISNALPIIGKAIADISTKLKPFIDAMIADLRIRFVIGFAMLSDKIKNWFNDSFKPALQSAFQAALSGLGIDWSGFLAVYNNYIKPVFDGLIKDVADAVNSLKTADWSGAIDGISKLIIPILSFGLAIALLAAMGIGIAIKFIADGIKLLVDSVAAANQGDWGAALIKGLLGIGAVVGGIVILGIIPLLASAIGALAASVWALLAPVLIVLAPIIALIGIIAYAYFNNIFGFGDIVRGLGDAFRVLGDSLATIAKGGMAAVLITLRAIIVGYGELAKAMNQMDDYWKAQGVVADIDAALGWSPQVTKGTQTSSGTNYGGMNYAPHPGMQWNGHDWVGPAGMVWGGSGWIPAGGSNSNVPIAPQAANNPVKSSQSGSNQTIIIQKVIVQDPNDMDDLYIKVKREASRRNSPIETKSTSYA